MGLLDGLLGALAGQARSNSPAGGGLGGLGDLLSGGRGRSRGGADLITMLLPIVLAMMQNRGAAGGGGMGGLGGLLQQFQQAGLGQQADSWVGTGANAPISPDAVVDVFGRDRVAQIAAQAGVSEAEASTGLAALLPEFVNQLTPAGQMPANNEVDDALGDLQRSLGI